MSTDESELDSAVNEVLDNQLKDGDPPETKQTLDRLIASGHDAQTARKLITDVLLLEIRAVMATGEPYNNARYTSELSNLPDVELLAVGMASLFDNVDFV